MNWTLPENSLVSYNIIVFPRNDTMISIIDSTRANLTLSYNIPYDVTVVADFCGQRNATKLTEFTYGKWQALYQTLDYFQT